MSITNSSSPEYTELAKAKVHEKRNLVVSKNNHAGGYTLAQQLTIQEGTKQINIFIKGAIHVGSLEGLYNLRDAVNEALTIEENNQIENI